MSRIAEVVSRAKRLVPAAALVGAVLAVAACGSEESAEPSATASGGSSAADAKPATWGWLFGGPLKDGGFNESFGLGIDAVKGVGDKAVTQDNLPYDRAFTQAVSRQIANGTNVLVEALGAGELFDTCTKSPDPDVKCYTPVTEPGNIPENTVGYWQAEWNLQYVAGVAAGLKTETDTLGFVSPFKLPVTYMAVNSFALGCQSVNPDCKVRVVVINSYFNPAAAAKATNTLIDSGADVLSSYLNDPTYCQVAQKRGVFAIGLYSPGFAKTCSDSVIVSTLYDVSEYFKAEAESMRDGTWKGGVLEWIEVGDGPGKPRLSDFNTELTTPELREKVTAEYEQILAGDSPFKGPITDQRGKVRVPEGKKLTNEDLWYRWNYYVKGVIGT